MNTYDNERASSDQSKPRRAKSREVRSRFLSPTPTSTLCSPNRKESSSTQYHRILEDSGSIQGLLPSSTSNSSTKKESCHADERKSHQKSSEMDIGLLQSKQRAFTQFSWFEDEMESTKENDRPSLETLVKCSGKSSSYLSSRSPSPSYLVDSPFVDDDDSIMVPGRFSVDECALYRTSSGRNSSFYFAHDSRNLESDSECSDISTTSNFSTSSLNQARKPGIEVPSKYLRELQRRPSRGNSDCKDITDNRAPASNSRKVKNFSIKNAIKRTNSMARYGSSMSQWALSPGRSVSPPISVETKGMPMTFSRLKLPTGSPPRPKGVSKLLNMGLGFFKSKKSSPSSTHSPPKVKSFDMETVHQLRLLHNRLIQWRIANATTEAISKNIVEQVEKQLLCAWYSLSKSEHSVLQKKIQLQRAKLEKKLHFILQSQIKHLETWEGLERQHLSALSTTTEFLQSVVCKVPLIEGAKVDMQPISTAFRQASDLTFSIESILATFSPSVEKSIPSISELAEVVAQEKLMLEECHELLRMISELEIQERSLKCSIIQS